MYEHIVVITRTIYMMPRSLRLINMPEEKQESDANVIYFVAISTFILGICTIFSLKTYITKLVRKLL